MDEYSQSEQLVDATDSIEVYEHGKTLSCPECGHDIGVQHKAESFKCRECDKILVDEKADQRESQWEDEKEGEQAGLDDWM